jgi:L-threonylcarbamoyladenylate synthase
MAVTRLKASEAGIGRAGAALAAGELVAFPTETVYGLGADGTNPRAVANIYRVKGRPPDNPLILHVVDAAAAQEVARVWPADARRLADRLWPGPLTLVVPARPTVPSVVRGGLDTVAVRCPSHPVARRLLAAAGLPVAAPSANRSGQPSPTTADAVARALGGPDVAVWLVDGGASPIGVESTVVDVSRGRPVLLRPGGLPRAAIEEVVGPLDNPGAGEPARSPGMRYRHYAPDRPLVLLAMDPEAAVKALRPRPAARTGLLAERRVVEALGWPAAVSLGDRPTDAAAALFEGLMTLDRWPGLDRLVAVWNNREGVGWAVMNRLERAAEEVVRT